MNSVSSPLTEFGFPSHWQRRQENCRKREQFLLRQVQPRGLLIWWIVEGNLKVTKDEELEVCMNNTNNHIKSSPPPQHWKVGRNRCLCSEHLKSQLWSPLKEWGGFQGRVGLFEEMAFPGGNERVGPRELWWWVPGAQALPAASLFALEMQGNGVSQESETGWY